MSDQRHFHGEGHSRLRQFIHPSGRKIHIAATPEEHEKLKQELTQSSPDVEFDLWIRGSPEHVQAIRELKTHHETRRASIRENHTEIYNDFEHIQSELSAIALELDSLTDHHITLDANFSKFGYSAHLRTIDVEEQPLSSSQSAFSDLSEMDKPGVNLKFWKRPVVRQYFHKGLLWRSKASGEVKSFELFIDLLYVGVIGAIGDTASEDAEGSKLLHYLITYTMSAKMWTDITNTTNWFETGDVMQRLTNLTFHLCLLGFTVNVASAFDDSYTAMIAFYLGERLLQASYFIWVAIWVPTIRSVMTIHSTLIILVTAVWIASIHVEYPARLGLIIPALVVDTFASMSVALVMRSFQKFNASGATTSFQRGMKRISSHFEFFPAFNIEHRVERNNTFVALIFGYSVLAILYQNRFSVFASNAIFGKACLSLIQAYCFNWMYFEIDLLHMKTHAIRRHYFSAWIWMFGHLPFIMGYTLAAASMSKIVLAHDVSNATELSLREPYDERSLEVVPSGLRWFYCGGLAVALVFSCIISLAHVYNVAEDARLTRESRLLVRSAAALAILLLPLAPKEHLQSLALVGITCSIIIGCLVVDLYGLSSKDRDFWTGGFSQHEKKNVKYKAHCSLGAEHKEVIKDDLERGHRTTIRDLLRKSEVRKEEKVGGWGWNRHHNADTHLAN